MIEASFFERNLKAFLYFSIELTMFLIKRQWLAIKPQQLTNKSIEITYQAK